MTFEAGLTSSYQLSFEQTPLLDQGQKFKIKVTQQYEPTSEVMAEPPKAVQQPLKQKLP